jgi:ribosome-associated protein
MKTKPSAPKKSAAKKAPAKKASAKKPAVKKSAPKKAAPKKTAVKKTPKKKLDATRVLVEGIREALESKKVENIVVINVSEVSSVTDYMVLCTGLNTPHLRALSDAVIKQRRQETPTEAPIHRAGSTGSEWLVLDYFNIVVHFFTPAMRTYYALEQLWKDAPIVK